jgi:hypothetical protein
MRKSWRLSPAVALVAIAAGCSHSDKVGPGDFTATLDVSPASFDKIQDDSFPFVAHVRLQPSGKIVLNADKYIRQSFGDPTIAEVSGSRYLVANNPGSTTLTLTFHDWNHNVDATTTVPINVSANPVVSVSVTPAIAKVKKGNTLQLTGAVVDGKGAPLKRRARTWSSSDTNVATVDATGKVTTKALGTVTITLTAEGKSASSSVTVKKK